MDPQGCGTAGYGLPTLVSLVANMFVLAFGPFLARLIGPSVNRAVAKVSSLFLAAMTETRAPA